MRHEARIARQCPVVIRRGQVTEILIHPPVAQSSLEDLLDRYTLDDLGERDLVPPLDLLWFVYPIPFDGRQLKVIEAMKEGGSDPVDDKGDKEGEGDVGHAQEDLRSVEIVQRCIGGGGRKAEGQRAMTVCRRIVRVEHRSSCTGEQRCSPSSLVVSYRAKTASRSAHRHRGPLARRERGRVYSA